MAGVRVPNLKALRERQALSQRDLVVLAHVSPTTVVRAEAGETIYLATVRKLAKALKVKPAELMEG